MGYDYFPPVYNSKLNLDENMKILFEYDKKYQKAIRYKYYIITIGTIGLILMIIVGGVKCL